ncbi:E3 ubiquitin-protein ligase RGLG4-like isoform X1 [Pyrus x bretschneideri]|uniref:E3 ubiquitin-protein ligase RGLG4-like isoform X1 n=1 Tax=Pyrus x bretschneideri TaxID=225117 RepID=UPI00202EEF3D|nr:E3 ubiquitin-protein ligase RGLG4-like isoform X1 [Pyrus x bretschneideri]
MGNLLSLFKSKQNSHGVSRSISGGTAGSNHGVTGRTPSYDPGMSRKLNINDTSASKARSGTEKHKYAYIPDNYTSLQQVTDALRKEGLESSNLIVGIDFTKSNEWTGKVSFRNRSLHAIGDEPNPYEKAISIIGKTLAPFDEDNLIPCFGFGDATTHDQEVFSFHNDHSPCHGFEEVLACYKRIVPNLRLWGPTSYGPVVEAAMDIVEKSGGQYHVLVIIADGQVTRSIDTSDNELSPQEQKTIGSIADASFYPLSIVLVGVGDGPWEDMRKFDDKLPSREFDNFQFVNFTEIMSKHTTSSEKETAFALAALMEIPIQYKAAVEFGILGRTTGKKKKIVPRPPPVPYTHRAPTHEPSGLPAHTHRAPTREPSGLPAPAGDERSEMLCPICLTNGKDIAFGCGHMSCRDCAPRLSDCPICRQPIRSRLRVFTG